MSDFYCVYNSASRGSLDVSPRLRSLAAACKELGVRFRPMDESRIDSSKLPTQTSEDGLYNCAKGSYLLERALINRRVKTFYRDYELHSQRDNSNLLSIELDKQGLRVPKTVYGGTSDSKLLAAYVDYLGGFPMIIKCQGGAGGIGVIKAEDFGSLSSICDYLAAIGTITTKAVYPVVIM